jgi:Major Facilitator Superfamily
VRLPASLTALRERSLARYVAATAVSALGSGAATVALAFAVLHVGDFSDLGIVILVRELPVVALLLLGGVWADRVSRKLILVSCDFVRGSAQLATAVLLLTGSGTVWSVAAAQAVFGMATAFSRPAHTGLVKQVVAHASLQQANALVGLTRSVSFVAGPAIGAILVELASPGVALAADAASFGVSAVLIGGLRLAPTRDAEERNSVLVDLRGGWSEFRSRRWVWLMVCSFGLFQLTYFPALLVLGPAVAEDELGGAGAWGTILAVGSAGAIVGGLFAFRVRFSRPLVASAALTAFAGLLLVALAFPAPLLALAAVSFLGSAALGLTDPLWFTTLQKHVPEHAISRISSFDWLGSVALNPIGYVAIGPLASAIGVGKTLAISGGVNIATCWVLAGLPAIRGLRDDAEPATPAARSEAGP